MKIIKIISFIIIIILVGGWLGFKSLTVDIPIGQVGVRIQQYGLLGQKGVIDKDFGPGWHRNLGPIDKWELFDSTIQTLEMTRDQARGDVRSEVLNELDHQIGALQRFQSHAGVDGGRLDDWVKKFARSRDEISRIGTGFLQPLKDSEFLNAIKHRSAIPGGTCEFDLPAYSHWVRQPIDRRQEDMADWLQAVRPLCDGVSEVLWLIRESAQPREKNAVKGMYQHNMQKDGSCRLLRVSLAEGSQLFPEISGSQHRFTVRLLEWSTVNSRAVQTRQDVPCQLAIC